MCKFAIINNEVNQNKTKPLLLFVYRFISQQYTLRRRELNYFVWSGATEQEVITHSCVTQKKHVQSFLYTQVASSNRIAYSQYTDSYIPIDFL